MGSGSEEVELFGDFWSDEDAGQAEDTVFDEMLANPGLMEVPKSEYHTGPSVESLYTGPTFGLGAQSTEGAGGMEDLGVSSLGGGLSFHSGEVGLDTPLELVTCGPIVVSKCGGAPPWHTGGRLQR
jgi:hypothetical protein